MEREGEGKPNYVECAIFFNKNLSTDTNTKAQFQNSKKSPISNVWNAKQQNDVNLTSKSSHYLRGEVREH